MTKQAGSNISCWTNRLGWTPPGVKLRAAQGFDAADFFITGYWIWNKILENLATIGYDPSNAFTAAYDWRLSYMNLEVRDKYFTKLKSYIEVAHKTTGHKTVLGLSAHPQPETKRQT